MLEKDKEAGLEQLRLQVAGIRASDILGRSGKLLRLFDFFVECASAGRVPKEIEVALEVFGKGVDFDVAQDALVRVYIHKLRRRLDEYYAGAGRNERFRLALPKGDYRLEVESNAVVPLPSRRRWLPWALAGLAVLLAANLARPLYQSASHAGIQSVRTNPVWNELLSNGQTTYVVVGDYYLFGELEANGIEVSRLVRDFEINSRNDLARYTADAPERAERYMDMGLQYLPISVASALVNIAPLLDAEHGQVRVVQASALTPSMLKSSNIIYIGLLSGMGSTLRDLVFLPARFEVGDTYDELIDRKTGKRYVSEAWEAVMAPEPRPYGDYGYFSTFEGPNGHRVIIIAGTRDVAVMHTAEVVSRRESIEALINQVQRAPDFEALFSVQAIDGVDVGGQVLVVDSDRTDPTRLGANPNSPLAPVKGKGPD